MKLSTYLFLLPIITIHHLSAQLTTDTVLTIQNINIQGQYFTTINSGSIKQLNTSSNISSNLGTTSDIIRQLPSVNTDIEGSIFFRGSSKSAQLIRGVPYGFLEEQSGDVLIQLPASFFSQITVLSQPDLSFLPDGESGVFSYTSIPEYKTSSSLNLTLGGGSNQRYTAGIKATVTPGKWSVTTNYNYRREYRERSFYKLTTNSSGSTEMDNNASAHPEVHIGDITVGYLLSDKDYLTVYTLLQHMQYDRYGGINNTRRNSVGDITNKIIRHRYNNQGQDAYAAEATWLHTFWNKGKLNIRFNYNNFSYDENNHYENEQFSTGKIIAQDNLNVNQDKSNYFFSTNVYYPFQNGYTFNIGYMGRIQNEDYKAKADNLTNGDWMPNLSKSTDFNFVRYINLGYASLQKTIAPFTIEIGMQAEHTKEEINSPDLNGKMNKNKVHIYPKANLDYQVAENGIFSLGYQQRTNRPIASDLNPFIDRADITYIKQGNPNLAPEVIHLAEASYAFTNNYFSITPAIYYRHKSNRIMDIANQVNDEIRWTKQNTGNSNTWGIEISTNWKPINRLSMSASSDIYRDQIDGRTIGYDEKKEMTCLLAKALLSFQLTPNTQLQTDGYYISDQLTAQGEIQNRYSVNVGIAQYLLKKKLKASLSVNNIFDSMEETTRIQTSSFQQIQIRNRDSRVTWLTLSYNL